MLPKLAVWRCHQIFWILCWGCDTFGYILYIYNYIYRSYWPFPPAHHIHFQKDPACHNNSTSPPFARLTISSYNVMMDPHHVVSWRAEASHVLEPLEGRWKLDEKNAYRLNTLDNTHNVSAISRSFLGNLTCWWLTLTKYENMVNCLILELKGPQKNETVKVQLWHMDPRCICDMSESIQPDHEAPLECLRCSRDNKNNTWRALEKATNTSFVVFSLWVLIIDYIP